MTYILIGYSLRVEQNQRQRDGVRVFKYSGLQVVVAWINMVAGER